MKKVVLCCLVIFNLACSDDDTVFENDSDLVGTWLLIEQYADPGDGSGDFRKVDSDKVIVFSSDGTYESSGSLCFMGTTSDVEVTGTYEINAEEELTAYSADNFLTPEDCGFDNLKVFVHFEGSDLILSYICIEGCAQKYRKL